MQKGLLAILSLTIILLCATSCGNKTVANDYADTETFKSEASASADVGKNDGIYIQQMLSTYANRNNELRVQAYNMIHSYEDNYGKFYVEVPNSPDLLQNIGDSFIKNRNDELEDYAFDLAESVFGTSAIGTAYGLYGNLQTIKGLFNIDTTPKLLMSCVAADILDYTTVLNIINQNGEIKENEMFAALDSFGNFIQRLSSINNIYSSSWLYSAEHQVMMNIYSEYMANKEILAMLETLEQYKGSSKDTDRVNKAITAVLDNAKGCIITSDVSASPFNTLTLNYDKSNSKILEKTSSLQLQLNDILFEGLVKDLFKTGLEDNANNQKIAVYSGIVQVNSLASKALNADIAVLNELKKTIDARAEFLKGLVDDSDKPEYSPIYKALSQMSNAELTSFLSFDGLISDFKDMCYEAYLKLGIIRNLYDVTLMESSEKDAFISDIDDMLGNIYVYINNYVSENNEAIKTRVDLLNIDCIDIQRQIIAKLANDASGTAGTYFRYQTFTRSGNYAGGRVYNVSTTAAGNGSFLLIEEHQFNSREYVPRYSTYYNRDGSVYYIEDLMKSFNVYFDNNGVVLQTNGNDAWLGRIDKNMAASLWLFDNLYTCDSGSYYVRLSSRDK